MQGQIIYLDNAASTQCLVPPSEITGNPSSRSHYFGITARKQIEASRSTIAEVLGVTSERLVFTSGASESARIIHHSLGMELVSETAHNCMFFGGIKKIYFADVDTNTIIFVRFSELRGSQGRPVWPSGGTVCQARKLAG